MTSTAPAVIVDGYSTGNFLPPAFHELGVDVVHVQSTPRLLPSMGHPDLDEYRDSIAFPAEGLSAIAAHAPMAVVAGSELAVELADELSERLRLPSNGTRMSAARRDKYRMAEVLRAAGLHCARQFVSEDPAELVEWAGNAGYPVVVKPLASASTENVRVCRSASEVAEAATEVLSATTMFAQRNTAVLAQTYLSGTEYIVDTVSRDGQRYVCGIWEYEKTISAEGRPLYDRDVLVDPDSPQVAEMVSYVDAAMSALGISHGPAHAEVIMTPDGPALVEVGARLNGNMNPGFHDRCIGANQAALTALAAARPDEFLRRYGGQVYSKQLDAAVFNTQTLREGVVEAVDQSVVDAIAALPTVYLVVVRLRPGDRMTPTASLLTSPMRVFMAGDEAGLRADRKVIEDLKDRVYRLAGDNA